MPALFSILDFAYRIGFTNLYDWQCPGSCFATRLASRWRLLPPSGTILIAPAAKIAES
jgi:hypothetical protein